MKLALLLACGMALAGCSQRIAYNPKNGAPIFKSTRFANNETIKKVVYVSPTGERFEMEGFGGNQVDALGVITKAAVEGAVGSAVPGASMMRSVPDGYKLVPKDLPSTPQYVYPDHVK